MENALWDYFETSRDAGEFSDEKIETILENQEFAGSLCRKFMLSQENKRATEWFQEEVKRYKRHLELRARMDARHVGTE